MRELGADVRKAGRWTAEKATTVGHAVRDSTMTGAHRVQDAATGAADATRERVDSVKDKARHYKDEVKVRAEAVAESSRRAVHAPRRIGHELMEAAGAWWRGLLTAVAMMVVVGVIGLVAFIVLTIALVAGLNRLVGDPLGTFLVALIYVVLAGIAYAVSRGARTRARNETERHMENSREEVRRVGAPIKSAFGRGRSGI